MKVLERITNLLIKILLIPNITKKRGINVFISKHLGGFGKVVNLKFDNKKRYLNISLELKGELEPVTIEVTNYEISEHNGLNLHLNEISISKDWLDILAKKVFIEDKTAIPLPDRAKDFLSILK